MANSRNTCPICNLSAEVTALDISYNQYLYSCAICGRFAFGDDFLPKINKDKLASYLYYNFKLFGKQKDDKAFLYICYAKNIEYNKTDYLSAICKTLEEIELWYPRNFNEKINAILLGLSQLSLYHGYNIEFSNKHYFFSLFFIRRYIYETKEVKLPEIYFHQQIKWISDYGNENNLFSIDNKHIITILPEGWKRIDELQKNLSLSKQVFVAMAFSEKTKNIREAIRQGVIKAGYEPRFIDEKEHNKQIVPEILYEIRKSKFIIVELTGHNNGAYYEAGYAAGLGKEVIHICSKETFGSDGHFDVKQKSSILWNNENEIATLLYKRIEATIDLDNDF